MPAQLPAQLLIKEGAFLLEDIFTEAALMLDNSDFSFSASNPDLLIIEGEEKSSIGIEQIKFFITWVNKKPFSYPVKVGVILSAEKMTTQAQNALLKTLEEPAENTQIVLICENPGRLLPTILSRVVKTTLSAGGEKITQKFSDLSEEFLHGEYFKRRELITDELANFSRTELASFVKLLIKKIVSDPAKWSRAISEDDILIKLEQILLANERGVNQKLLLENMAII